MKRIFFLLSISFLTVSQLNAQADSVTLITDRPTQSASPYTIAKGTWQIETGLEYGNFKSPIFLPAPSEIRVETITYNNTLVRFGITDKLELNFSQSLTSARGFINDVQQGSTITDLTPTALGLRVHVAEEKGGLPQISLLTSLVGEPFVEGRTGYSLDARFNMQHNLHNGWSVGYNLGANGIGSNFTPLYTFVVGKSLDEKLGVFAEAYGFFNSEASDPHSLLYGFTYLLNKDAQLDIYAGNALNEFATDFIFGLGFSVRIPGK